MPGPSFHLGGSYASQTSLYHTMDPYYSALYRMHPIPSNLAATQQLNAQGLFPTGSQRVDFSNANYPADIEMRRKNTPECNTYESKFCPGMKATPWNQIVERRSCSACPLSAGVASPHIGEKGLNEVFVRDIRYDVQNLGDANCQFSKADLSRRPVSKTNSCLPYPYRSSLSSCGCEEETVGGSYSARQHQPNVVQPKIDETKKALLHEGKVAVEEAKNAVEKTNQVAEALKESVSRQALSGNVSQAAAESDKEKQVLQSALVAKQLVEKSQVALQSASAAVSSNQSTEIVLEKVKEGVKSSQASVSASLGSPAKQSAVLSGYIWSQF